MRHQFRSVSNKAGFALPLVVIMLVVLSMSLAAGLAATAAETGTTTAQRGQNRAYAIAELGLQRFLVSRDSLCALAGASCLSDPAGATSGQDSVNLTVNGGRAVVVARLLRPQQGTKDTIPALFLVRSMGVDSTSKLRGGDTTTSVRTVGMIAQWSTQTMNVTGAWTSLSGLNKQGSAGQIDGNDQCGRKPAVAGVMVPKGQYSATGNFVPTGNPPLDTTKSLSQLEAQMTIDWNGIINGNAIQADFNVGPDAFPSAAWFAADTSRWPVIRVHANGFSLPAAGRGIIIADSDFTISGSNMWNGVILVGGKLTSNGNNTTSGATMSGLNYLLPDAQRPGQGTIIDDATANGNKTYVYNSCSVARATQRLRHFVAIADTWIDDVPTW
jgi:Tfp pilus assembly protein PilV